MQIYFIVFALVYLLILKYLLFNLNFYYLLPCFKTHFIFFSDKKMQHYVMNLAKKKGLNVEPFTLQAAPHCQSPHANENCSIYVPDVGIIL